jgi:hypothetical protein
MADFDDLLGAQPEEAPAPEQPFDKEAWAAQKKEQREGLYALADETALGVVADPARFAQYLDTQARFDRYSATNALLVLAQRPDATQLGDLDHWKKERVFIKQGEMGNAILILPPGKEYRREDGSVGTGVDVKRVYDMSQAERPRLQPVPKYDDKALVRAVVHASPFPVEGVDQLGGLDAEFSPADDKIFVQRGMDASAIVRAVAREACLAQLGDIDLSFDARAGAYLVCKKFGVDVQDIDLSDVKERFSAMDEAKDVRDTLTGIRNAAGEITKSMAKDLEPRKPEARS